ncbi:hypothetical protein DXV76_16720 [Rhodobacteraceae bacterium CCMM004]|nr:hypothetical protein DXV76_16720 [Rhodobacteraceae bacterium CCMM004]
MSPLRLTALIYAVILAGAAALNYVPGVVDSNGQAFGIFELDLFDDALHAASALWALIAAALGTRASRTFLLLFGALYLADGLLGLATGAGYLDFGIFTHGRLDLPLGFRILANLPHLGLGGAALAAGLAFRR